MKGAAAMSTVDSMTPRSAERALPTKWTNFGGTRNQCDEVAAALLKEFPGVRFVVERHRRGDRYGVWIAGACDPITEEKIRDTGREFAIHREVLFTEETNAHT